MYIKFNCYLVKMSTMGDLYDTSGVYSESHEDYTSQDPDICLGDEKKYNRVKTNGRVRVNQSCKRKRAIPR